MRDVRRRLAIAGLILILFGLSRNPLLANNSERVHLVMDGEISKPVEHAITALKNGLQNKCAAVDIGFKVEPSADVNLIIGIPGQSRLVDQLLSEQQLSVPEEAESLLVAKIWNATRPQVLIAGRDPRGAAYALLEIAESIRLAKELDSVCDAIQDCRESPYLKVRSVTKQLFNQDVERDWYESEEYWHWYFGMLAKNRINNFSLTFGHNANYMIPPYAWMFDVPEYPDVQVTGMSHEDRDQCLHRFRRITEIAQEHGVGFTLGLWTQLPVVEVREGLDFGESPVINLPSGLERAKYCAKGLEKLLRLCPDIAGVQLRMNLESGIPHEEQERYYQLLFEGIAACGRSVKLDLRYKSLSQQTINLARDAGLDVNVSTKHWCEHMGLPYNPAAEDIAYSASRYGYGSMLRHDRNYRVTYRLWNVGTSRLLLWGDPGYAARFAESCTLGGGEGFEVFAPLSNQGYGDAPGTWRIFADEALEHYRWEQERYWAFYLAFGRFGYNPDMPRRVWSREFAHRFGDAGAQVEAAFRATSQVLPLITATTQFSANNWRFWPEMMACMHLDAYRAIQPSDYAQFYAIAPFASRQQWRSEGWASIHSAYVEDAIQGNLNAKWTPIQVSRYLSQLADETEVALAAAEKLQENSAAQDPEFDATLIDLKVLALLARYHADKKIAATHLEFFRITNEKTRLKFAWKHIQAAQNHWTRIVDLTNDHYYDDLVLGFSKEYNSDFASRLQEHIGHWKDRIVDVQKDVDFVAHLMDQNAVSERSLSAAEEKGMKRYPGETLEDANITFRHERIKSTFRGQAIPVVVHVSSDRPLDSVSVYYRPLNQTKSWNQMAMVEEGADGAYQAQIPAEEIDPNYDLQYYIEARHAEGGALWPNWLNETPYVVVPVIAP
ncbi:hypothetical protein M4951_15885 [Blastopirellula sp. J2-11]|uniref:hypothetical protein n=1 Tax=Blastopirellula sp. J2-11 TaxID=2943192 RepID=UPI0021C83C27|nr:hypothetical protein [Blastopirellula sp. J2-11]UUO04866.1 hypothetical protein M4951_15885 [Blastopirellula sp. J2-11]